MVDVGVLRTFKLHDRSTQNTIPITHLQRASQFTCTLTHKVTKRNYAKTRPKHENRRQLRHYDARILLNNPTPSKYKHLLK